MLDGMGDSHSRPMSQVAAVLSGRLKLGFEEAVTGPRRLSGDLDARRDPRAPPSATEEMVQPARISLTNWAVCPIWSLKRWYIPIITVSAGLMPLNVAPIRSFTCCGESTVRPGARTLYARHGFLALRIVSIIRGGSEGRLISPSGEGPPSKCSKPAR